MFHWLRTLWQALCGALRHSGGAHYVTGGPGLPPPLTPEQEKALLAEMAAGSAAARDALITHNLRLVSTLPKSTRAAACPPKT